MWRTRLIAGLAVTAMFVTGLAFLIAACFLALQQALGATVAAAIVGGALIGAAGIVVLIVALIRPAPPPAAAVPSPLGQAAGIAGQAGSLHASIDVAQQLALVMRNLNPVTIGAVIAGVLYGMIRR
ncbi:MAG: hypothetical protein JNM30_04275 [Rhodospirillales bacterium]|nr:hypothetical protein [Rhodospirillales bacterium]